MTEEITTEPQPLTTFIGDNGELKDGWKDAVLPENIRSEPIYNQIKDIKGAFSIIGNQAKLVGRKNTIPDDKSPVEEWNTFYDTWGRPKTSNDYKLDVPETIKEFIDDEKLNNIKSSYHKAGLNQKQAEHFWSLQKSALENLKKEQSNQFEKEKLEAEGQLKTEWGGAYQENMNLVSRMVVENGGDLTDWLLEEYGNNPKMAKFLYNISKKFVEHKVITDVDTPIYAADTKIKQLMSDPAYLNSRDIRHKDLVQQVQRLFEEKVRLSKK